MKFTNVNVNKEIKKLKNQKWIWILLLVLSAVFLFWGTNEDDKASKNVKDLHSIIIDKSEDKADKKSYVNINTVPYKFAIYDDRTEAYYFVMDEKYIYVAYMGETDYTLLNTEDIKINPKKIEGVTRYVTKDIKELAINAYNEAMKNEEDKLGLADYDNYFGSVYLDMTTSVGTSGSILFALSFIALFAGIITFIIERINSFKFKRNLKRLTDSEIMTLDSEMNSSDAFYYGKAHLYLTNNYIINFNRTFKVIKYEDLIWIYPFEYRYNGVKTTQSIIVVTKDGKKNTIASIDVITKKKQEVYNEIFNTILSKNKNMIVGYNKESIKKANEIIKNNKNMLK